MNKPAMISCIIPTYKRSSTLIRAINSVLNQTFTNIEIIIVDDNEPNDEFSLEVQKCLCQIDDYRIKYLQQKEHKNGAVARNFGVYHSKGEFIAFLDDDDEWKPDKLEVQLQTLENLEESYGAIACKTTYYKDGKEVLVSKSFTEEGLQKKVLERTVSFNTSTVLFRKECLIDTGIFNEKLERHQDLQLFVDFLDKYRIKPLDISLINYHVDDDINRPSAERILDIKEKYFMAVKPIIDKYSEKEQKDIYAAHYFEIVHLAVKEKKYKLAFRYVRRIGLNVSAYVTVGKRFIDRI